MSKNGNIIIGSGVTLVMQLSCQNLTLGYEGKTVKFGLSFTVNAGDYLCIVGENGFWGNAKVVSKNDGDD